MHLVRLKHYHREVKTFSHPLLDAASKVGDIDFEDLVTKATNEAGRRDLANALLGCLRYLISLYRGCWPQCEPHLDDMVSEGVLAIQEVCQDPQPDILKIASQKIKDAIEIYLNKNQSLASPSMRTQNYRISRGHGPIYLEYRDDEEDKEAIGDIYKRDIMEALEQLDAKDWIDATILCQDNWDLNDEEMASKCGVSRTSVWRRRKRLYREFLRLTR